jgi:hypothetical protein
MNKHYTKIYSTLVFFIILAQAFIYYYNTKPSTKVFSEKSISVENFSSIVLSTSGMTKIGSEKLNKIDENNIFLQGQSYLENKDYKIYGNNISIDMKNEVSQSKENVKVINSMGELNASGFKNVSTESKIYFKGQVIFKSND